jgi:hypothetical protein
VQLSELVYGLDTRVEFMTSRTGPITGNEYRCSNTMSLECGLNFSSGHLAVFIWSLFGKSFR